MTDTRLVKKRYISMSVVLLGLAFVLFLLPEKQNPKELKPEHLMAELNDETRFVSTDFVSDKIIQKDPSIQLIDVRTAEEFEKFKLEGALNIPLADILEKDEKGNYVWEDYLNQDIKQNVFYSNGTVYANQAWMLLRRLNFKNNSVMKGGLNKWIETIIKPKKPHYSEGDDAFALYSKRKGASMYFGGGSVVPASSSDSTAKSKPIIKKNKKAAEEEGGC